MSNLMFDRVKAAIQVYTRKNPIQLSRNTGTSVQDIKNQQLYRQRYLSLLLNSTRFNLTHSSREFIEQDILTRPDLIQHFLPNLHLPFPKIFVVYDETTAIQYEVINNDIYAFLLMISENKQANNTLVDELHIDILSYMLTLNSNTLLDNNLSRNLSDVMSIDSATKLPRDFQQGAFEYNHVGTKEEPIVKFIMDHTAIIPNKNEYLIPGSPWAKHLPSLQQSNTITQAQKVLMIKDLEGSAHGDIFQIPKVLSVLLALNLKSYIPCTWTPGVRNSKGGKTGLSHTVVDIDVNAKTYLPKPPGIPTGTGSKKREHEVRGHWNVSHKTGNQNCQGICQPTRITDKRIKCVKCGKKSWLVDAHKRGDASLGAITHEYQSLVS